MEFTRPEVLQFHNLFILPKTNLWLKTSKQIFRSTSIPKKGQLFCPNVPKGYCLGTTVSKLKTIISCWSLEECFSFAQGATILTIHGFYYWLHMVLFENITLDHSQCFFKEKTGTTVNNMQQAIINSSIIYPQRKWNCE